MYFHFITKSFIKVFRLLIESLALDCYTDVDMTKEEDCQMHTGCVKKFNVKSKCVIIEPLQSESGIVIGRLNGFLSRRRQVTQNSQSVTAVLSISAATLVPNLTAALLLLLLHDSMTLKKTTAASKQRKEVQLLRI